MAGIMDEYKKLVDFLGEVMGKNCEIVLQDLSPEERSIVKIVNSYVSNRAVGSPLTDYALKVMADEAWRKMDYDCNYYGRTKNNKLLRSSTFYIKEHGKLVGMLCINVDSSEYIKLSERILEIAGVDKKVEMDEENQRKDTSVINVGKSETLSASVEDMVASVIHEFTSEHNHISVDHLSQDDRMEIVKRLEAKGIFLLKGAVICVADGLCCSEASVYRYLSKISKDSQRVY